MKCSHCGKEYTHESVRKQYGTQHYADYGCCSEQCYTNRMTGIPPLPNQESQNQ